MVSENDEILTSLVIYVIFQCTFTLLLYLVIAKGSALLSFLAMMAVLPITAILAASYTWPVIGQAVLPLSQLLALGIILSGIAVYRQGQIKHDTHPDANQCLAVVESSNESLPSME